jgi:phage host-nuclease inhibitor protein Gam
MYQLLIIILITIFFMSIISNIEHFSENECVNNCKKGKSSGGSSSNSVSINNQTEINTLKDKQSQILINQSNINNRIDNIQKDYNNKINNLQTEVTSNTQFKDYINQQIAQLKSQMKDMDN